MLSEIIKWLLTSRERKEAKRRFIETGCSDYPGVGKVMDADVGEYAFKHLRFIDRFNPKMVGPAVLVSQLIKFGEIEEPDDPDWKFPDY